MSEEEKENMENNDDVSADDDEETIDDLFGEEIDAQKDADIVDEIDEDQNDNDVETVDLDDDVEEIDIDAEDSIEVDDISDADIEVVDLDSDIDLDDEFDDDSEIEIVDEIDTDEVLNNSESDSSGGGELDSSIEGESIDESLDEESSGAISDENDDEDASILESEPPQEDTESESETIEEEPRTVTIKELTEKAKKKNLIEAAIFIAGRPVGAEELNIKLELGKKEAEDLVKELAFEYQDRNTSIEIVRVGDKYSMQLKAEYTDEVKRFTSGGLIPEAVMRTLTVVALKQPIKKSLLVKIRGSGAYGHVKFLEERGFVEGYKKGRTSVLSTSDQFADTFGLSRDPKTLKKQLVAQLGIEKPVKSGEEMSAEQKRRKQELKEKGKEIREDSDS